MHHFRHFYHGWKRGRAYAYAGASTRSPFNMESRGHHRRGSSSFGVRRPLRYLTYQLDLDDGQMRKVAAILNRLKTEQEQAEVDHRRTVGVLAEFITQDDEPLDESLKVALTPRVDSAKRLRDETMRAVRELHALLDAQQRERLAELLDSGTVAL